MDGPQTNRTALPTENAGITGFQRWMGRYWICLQTLGILVMLFTLLRVLLVIMNVEWSTISLADLPRMFWTGLRFDVMVGLIFLFPQFWHMTFTGNRRAPGWFSRTLIHAGLLFNFGVILFLLCSEYLFFDEFQSRFNYIAFEYLIYPTEVVTNLWESYPMVPLLGGIAALAIVIYLPMRKGTTARLAIPLPMTRRLGLFGAALAAIAGLWLTTDMSSLAVTKNRVANEISGNGLYSFFYYAWTNRFDYDTFYLTNDLHEGFQRVNRHIRTPTDQMRPDGANPLDRTVTSPLPRRDYNVVLVLEEGLGSDFIGELGDTRGLTPRIDALAREYCLFDNFFATGNRTARAIEATLSALPPIPTESILKRDHSDHVFTLARLLAERNYQRTFVYGGRGLFDGMRSFTMSNGFEKFIEQKHYFNPAHKTAWGVSDEDIFEKAIEEFDRMHAVGRPFFSLVLTVSNHKPFTYPDGRIDRPSAEQTRENAVKYADWAVGDFFEKARSHDFFDNTIFVIMGDHGARVYGAQMFPIKSYRVPVLLVVPEDRFAAGGPTAGKPGTRCSTLASSLDIAPTIMGLLGGSYDSVFYGRDALHIDPATGYALMQHNHDLAMLHADDRVEVLGCPNIAKSYRLNRSDFSLIETTGNIEDQKDAIAFYQTANRLYYDENYHPAKRTDDGMAGASSPVAP